MATSGCTAAVGLTLLGGFGLTVDGRHVELPNAAQRLLALLALRGAPLTRPGVCGALWPHAGADRANASLRSTLWRTQRLCGHSVIAAAGVDLALTPAVLVDLPVAVAQAHRLLEHDVACDDLLSQATKVRLSLSLLPGWYGDDWVMMEREFYDQLRLNALEALCVRMTAAGRYGEAVEAGLAVVRAEPLRESAHEKLIRAHVAAGNRWHALRQYQQYRQVLDDELGLEPSRTLTEFVRTACHRAPGRRPGPEVRRRPLPHERMEAAAGGGSQA
jgi:DNA-binding SARP family transcriptional activator